MSRNVVAISLERLYSTVNLALTAHGLNREAAACISSVVTDAERDGCTSHGLFRVPGFLHALDTGAVDGPGASLASLAPTSPAEGVVVVDGGGCSFAAPAFAAGRPELVRRARANGVACLVLQRVRHFSALWWEVEALAGDDRLLALAAVNSAAFVAHAPGGAAKVYGTNPLAFGCPRGEGLPPLVFDQASSTISRGDMQLAMAAGRRLPGGAAIFEGTETRDPVKALARRGAQLPFGGHKGTNVALMVELLAGVATNSPLAVEAAEELEGMALTALDAEAGGLPPGGVPTVNGELIIAVDPTVLFGGGGGGGGDGGSGGSGGGAWTSEAFTDRVEVLLRAVQASAADPSDEGALRLPSDRRYAQRLKTLERGGEVDLDAKLFSDIESAAALGKRK